MSARIIKAACWIVIPFLFLSCDRNGSSGTVTLSSDYVNPSSGYMFVQIASSGQWSLSLSFDGDAQWATLNRDSGSGSTNSIILHYDENSGNDRRTLVLTATFEDGSSSVTLTQRSWSDLSGGEGTQLPEDDDYPGLVSDVVRGWMELPSVEAQKGCAWVFHDMSINGSKYRNYSIYYDAENRLARWVAYPLNSWLRSTGSRHDQFDAVDPKIPYEYQPTTSRGWGEDGYDRGHQIPAADRYREDAHRQTFYPTNMTVQNSSLNQNIWADLEDKVRGWSESCDTLYVVTGCIPGTEFITDRGGKRVNVPSAYFKALLRYSRGPVYSGIAFYLENRAYTESVVNSSMTMTINELEDMLGTDFFRNLPETYADAAESSISSWWGIN